MSTIAEFIQQNVGRPNVSPKGLIMEAYAMGLAHGKGEEYEPVPEEEVEEVEEEVEEVEDEEPAYDGEEDELEMEEEVEVN